MSRIHFEKKSLRCCGPYNADHHNNKHVVKYGWVKKPLGGKIINRSFCVSALQTEVSITFFTFYQLQVKVLRLDHILSDEYTSPSHAQLRSCYLQKQTSHLHTENVCSRRAKFHTAFTIDVNSLHIRVSTLLIRWLMTANSLRSHHAFYLGLTSLEQWITCNLYYPWKRLNIRYT